MSRHVVLPVTDAFAATLRLCPIVMVRSLPAAAAGGGPSRVFSRAAVHLTTSGGVCVYLYPLCMYRVMPPACSLLTVCVLRATGHSTCTRHVECQPGCESHPVSAAATRRPRADWAHRGGSGTSERGLEESSGSSHSRISRATSPQQHDDRQRQGPQPRGVELRRGRSAGQHAGRAGPLYFPMSQVKSRHCQPGTHCRSIISPKVDSSPLLSITSSPPLTLNKMSDKVVATPTAKPLRE